MKGIVLFGHGSRDPLWRAPMDAVAARLADRGHSVRCAFLELQEPDLATAALQLAQAGAASIVVIPMFLGAGRHAREDLPLLIDELRARVPHLPIETRKAVGEDPRVLDLLADIAAE